MSSKSKPNQRISRQTVVCPVFGTPCEHSGKNLPSYSDVIKHYLFIRQEQKLLNNNKEPSFKNVSDIVVTYLENLWQCASLPSVTTKRIYDMLKSYHLKYSKIRKQILTRKSDTNLIKLKSFQDEANATLFDITACKCEDFETCRCALEKKVPVEERKFLVDQRTTKKLFIGTVDHAASAKKRKSAARKLSDLMRLRPFEPVPSTSQEGVIHNKKVEICITDSDSDNTSSTLSSEYEPSESTKRRITSTTKTKICIDTLAIMSDKTGTSDRAAATLATAILEGAGIVNKDDASQVIDRNKVRRARKRARSDLMEESRSYERIEGIYFDGRKDITKVQETVDSKNYVKSVTEEHVSLIHEPDSQYLGHISPITGSARNICASIMDFLHENNFDLIDVVAIGCDGTAVNTGHKNGVIRLLEEKLEKPLHWFVCLLHANELPLRHLINHVDGKTSGPATFTGPIGSKLRDCDKQAICDFSAIPSEVITIDSNELSTDQQYLLQIYNAVSSGECPNELALKNPGKMHHARWLTTANRILRLYVSEPSPSSRLLVIVNFIMRVYAPVWFSIKCNPSVFQGAKHLHKMINASRFLETENRAVIDKVLQNNAYFAHPENLLLSMIYDDSAMVRELGYRRILKAKQTPKSQNVRNFMIPKLRFDADEYHQMIDWQEIDLTEPPILTKLTETEIKELIETNEKPQGMPNFPCHTQAVERIIKLVTDASATVVGQENRDGYVRARLEGRKRLPLFETKCNYTSK